MEFSQNASCLMYYDDLLSLEIEVMILSLFLSIFDIIDNHIQKNIINLIFTAFILKLII